jgi:hypothetical protein
LAISRQIAVTIPAVVSPARFRRTAYFTRVSAPKEARRGDGDALAFY